jgi:tRNA threonylcarbamoyl adenosine modification protein (Sua5/YciO/YrdC/YwlC family)
VPTETVYGLAADARNGEAVDALYAAKGRPETKPLSVLVADMEMVERVCSNIPPLAYRLARAFWPGPLTMVLHDGGALPPSVTASGATLGVRCPDHPATLALLRAFGAPLAAPSANPSGRPSPKCADDVYAAMGGKSTQYWTAEGVYWAWNPPYWTSPSPRCASAYGRTFSGDTGYRDSKTAYEVIGITGPPARARHGAGRPSRAGRLRH